MSHAAALPAFGGVRLFTPWTLTQPRRIGDAAVAESDTRVVAMPASPSTRYELSALMKQVCEGDQQAFAQVYDLTVRSVFGIVLHVLRDHAQAEEVTQEVYVEAWQQAARFDAGQGAVSTWLNTIAHRRAVDRVRSSERRTQREQRHAEQIPRQPVPNPSDIAIANDEALRVRAAMELLSESQRTAVQMAYFEGKTQREVAELLQVPLGTVKTRIRDAMQRLRKHLGEVAS